MGSMANAVKTVEIHGGGGYLIVSGPCASRGPGLSVFGLWPGFYENASGRWHCQIMTKNYKTGKVVL